MTAASDELAHLSRWIDNHPDNTARDAEARTWGRLAKVAEESGELIAAFIGVTGQNPRKGVTATHDDVVREALDVALTALCAVEHLTGNDGRSWDLFLRHVDATVQRAGIPPEATR